MLGQWIIWIFLFCLFLWILFYYIFVLIVCHLLCFRNKKSSKYRYSGSYKLKVVKGSLWKRILLIFMKSDVICLGIVRRWMIKMVQNYIFSYFIWNALQCVTKFNDRNHYSNKNNVYWLRVVDILCWKYFHTFILFMSHHRHILCATIQNYYHNDHHHIFSPC